MALQLNEFKFAQNVESEEDMIMYLSAFKAASVSCLIKEVSAPRL